MIDMTFKRVEMPVTPIEKKPKPTGVKVIKVLFVIVDWNKKDFYQDLLEQYEVNLQMVMHGTGTAQNPKLAKLGLGDDKVVLLAIIKEDKEKKILDELDSKFENVKNGKGIAFTISMNSIIGTSTYRFLSNAKMGR